MAADGIAVLVVDDSASFREAAAEVVTAVAGFRLAGTTSSGEAAINVLRSTKVDLVLMDVVMPGMGGVQAAAHIHAEHPEVAVLLLSARALDDLPDLSSECPWCDYCPKADFGPNVLEKLCRSREEG